MIKRILRYTFLIPTLLLLAVWALSVRHTVGLGYMSGPAESKAVWVVRLHPGEIQLAKLSGTHEAFTSLTALKADGFQFRHRTGPWQLLGGMGLRLPRMEHQQLGSSDFVELDNVTIPFWLLVAPLMFVTAWLWRPWIRERRTKRSVGFEVEAKQRPAEFRSTST